MFSYLFTIKQKPRKGGHMLRKTKKYNNEPDVGETTKTEGLTERKMTAGAVPAATAEKTVIGEDISIKGSIHGRGNLLIQGSIKGTIDLDNHHLTVGPNGNVEAEVNAEHVTIGGHLAGNINAQGKVEITKTAVFTGEIKAKRISVEDGAYLKAVIELEREPKPQGPAKPAIPITKGPTREKEKPISGDKKN